MRVGDHQGASVFFCSSDNGVGFFNGAGDRLFEQHVATGFEAVDGSSAV